MYQVCIATGRTLATAIERARIRLDTYGRINPGQLFYRRPNDGSRFPLLGA